MSIGRFSQHPGLFWLVIQKTVHSSTTSSVQEKTFQEKTKRRSWFWIGFVLSFVLLGLASCGGAAMFIGLGDLSLADLQSSRPVWTPPPQPTTPPAAQSAPSTTGAQATPTGTFQPGAQARNVTSSRVNIRQVPGYLSKPAGDILAQIPPGGTVTILAGPRAADSLLWWRIRFDQNDNAVEGWVAESTASGVQILASVP